MVGSALFSKCHNVNHQDIQIAFLLCLHVQVHENVMVMPCMDIEYGISEQCQYDQPALLQQECSPAHSASPATTSVSQLPHASVARCAAQLQPLPVTSGATSVTL